MSIHYIETSDFSDNQLFFFVDNNGNVASTIHHLFIFLNKDFHKKINNDNYSESLLNLYNYIDSTYNLIYFPVASTSGECSEFDETNYPVSFDITENVFEIPKEKILSILKESFPTLNSNDILNSEISNSFFYVDNQCYGNSTTYQIIFFEKTKY